jgi:hypothetical protein
MIFLTPRKAIMMPYKAIDERPTSPEVVAIVQLLDSGDVA